jgi:YD repeat-containing protein
MGTMKRWILIGLVVVAAVGVWLSSRAWRRSADGQLAPGGQRCEFPAAFPCLEQVLRLEIPIAGTGFSLAYASDRASIVSGSASRATETDGFGGWSLSVLRHLDPTGGILVDDPEGPRQVHPVRPATGPETGHLLVAEPSGLRALVFDEKGRHLRTLDTLTGVPIAAFDYDAGGRLSAMRTRSGVTRIERFADGSVITIVSPAGWRTGLRFGLQGHLARVSAAGGGQILIETDGRGLVRGLTDPVGARWSYDYDTDGRLAAIHDPSSGATTFVRTLSGATERLEITSPLGRATVVRSTGVRCATLAEARRLSKATHPATSKSWTRTARSGRIGGRGTRDGEPTRRSWPNARSGRLGVSASVSSHRVPRSCAIRAIR